MTIALAVALGALGAGAGIGVAASGPGGGGGDETTTRATTTNRLEHSVEMDDFAFRPARLVVRRGQLVVWKNSDSAPHNAVALRQVNGKPAFATRTGGKGARLTARAPMTAGVYRYICTVHPRMTGTLVVR